MDPMNAWLIFAVSCAGVVLAGRKLSHYGEELAVRTGLGRAWIGAILLAGATSLPEVATSVAAAWQGAGNLAMGNVFGSNIFNVAILVLAQAAAARSILANASPAHIPVAAAGMLLSGLAAGAIVIRQKAVFLGAGLDAWAIALTYLLVLRLLPKSEEAGQAPERLAGDSRGGAGAVWLKFAMAAAAVVISGYFLTSAADRIAAETGLGQTFVGGTLLAAATSLPELTVTIVTAKAGSYDLALGNVLGSNIFNMLILVLADLALPGRVPILATASQGQLVAALLGLILSGIAVLALSAPRHKDVVTIGLTYLLGTWFLFLLR
jgi:cation:H+ antiporter